MWVGCTSKQTSHAWLMIKVGSKKWVQFQWLATLTITTQLSLCSIPPQGDQYWNFRNHVR